MEMPLYRHQLPKNREGTSKVWGRWGWEGHPGQGARLASGWSLEKQGEAPNRRMGCCLPQGFLQGHTLGPSPHPLGHSGATGLPRRPSGSPSQAGLGRSLQEALINQVSFLCSADTDQPPTPSPKYPVTRGLQPTPQCNPSVCPAHAGLGPTQPSAGAEPTGLPTPGTQPPALPLPRRGDWVAPGLLCSQHTGCFLPHQGLQHFPTVTEKWTSGSPRWQLS